MNAKSVRHTPGPWIIVLPATEVDIQAVLDRLDYHTHCVIADCSGYVHAAGLAQWVASGKSFSINPAWPTRQSQEWYRQHASATGLRPTGHVWELADIVSLLEAEEVALAA
jgi:hypothetical protein